MLEGNVFVDGKPVRPFFPSELYLKVDELSTKFQTFLFVLPNTGVNCFVERFVTTNGMPEMQQLSAGLVYCEICCDYL